MIISGQTLRERYSWIITPFTPVKTMAYGMSYGVSVAGYDIRCSQSILLQPGEFKLASSVEEFNMPLDLIGIVHDKSTWARCGLALQNTVIEPGWKGFLTLELSNHSQKTLHVPYGAPIAQILFHAVDRVTDGYSGKYQDQADGPQPAKFEHG